MPYAVAGAVLANLASNAMADTKAETQVENEQKLMNQQNRMNQHNAMMAYMNQVQGAKLAGLSPAMLNGATPQVAAPVSKGNAQMAENVEFDPASLLMSAQAENLKAQTEKTEAETDKIKGVDTENSIADTLLKNATTEEKKALTTQINNINEQYADENKSLSSFGKAMAQKWTQSDWFKALKPDTKETIENIANGNVPLTVGSMTALYKTINTQEKLSDADNKLVKNAFSNAVLETIFTNDDLWNAETEKTLVDNKLKSANTDKTIAETNKIKYRFKEIIDEEIDNMHSKTNVNNAEYWMKLKQKLAYEYENMDLSRAEGRYGNYAWRTMENALDKTLDIIGMILGFKFGGKALKAAGEATKSLPNQHGYNTPDGKPKSDGLETRGYKKGDKPSNGTVYDPTTKKNYRIDEAYPKSKTDNWFSRKADEYDQGVQDFFRNH